MSTHSKPTKRELREQRRAERLEAERAEAAAGARRRRTRMLLAAVGLAAAVVVIAVIATSGSSSSNDAAKAPSGEAASLFAGIPENNGVLGDKQAPLTLTEYLDPQCPICAEASRDTLPGLVRDYVRTGKVRLQARLLHFIGPDSVRAARYAVGAERQDRLWPFLETLYASQGTENSGYVTDEFLTSIADASGVDPAKAKQVADSAASQDVLNTANSDAQQLGINGTPTFTLARGDGQAQVIGGGRHDLQSVSDAIDQALGK
jgi:protein-disulfide isomerase